MLYFMEKSQLFQPTDLQSYYESAFVNCTSCVAISVGFGKQVGRLEGSLSSRRESYFTVGKVPATRPTPLDVSALRA